MKKQPIPASYPSMHIL